LVYLAKYKKYTLISQITGNTGKSLIFEGLRGGNRPVSTGKGLKALCHRGYSLQKDHCRKITYQKPKNTAQKLKNTDVTPLQPQVYIPP
jgi:hypothetical protein